MNPDVSDIIWLNESDACSLDEIAAVSGLTVAEVRNLVDSGVIQPVDERAEPPSYHLRYIVTARTAMRLRDDFELDRNGVAVALVLLQRIRSLENELRAR